MIFNNILSPHVHCIVFTVFVFVLYRVLDSLVLLLSLLPRVAML
jgi:hypothetical protein